MYWLRRPPFTRWIAAGLVVCCGLYLDLKPTAIEGYPFAAAEIAVGEAIEPRIEWRDTPAGLLPHWDGPVSGLAVANIPSGTPVLPSLATDVAIPPGWWAVSVPLPHPVAPGRLIRIALDDTIVEGIIIGDINDSGFQLTGSVAFPATEAAQVAAAGTHDALVVMIGAEDHMPGSTG